MSYNIKSLEEVLKVKHDIFVSNFWLDQLSFVQLYQELNGMDPEISVLHLLLFLNFIKMYPTTRQQNQMFGLAVKTNRKYIQKVFDCLANIIEEYQFDADQRFDNDPFILDGNEIFMAIDTCIFPIEKPTTREIERQFYSVKHGLHGIKFEACVTLTSGKICWLSPFWYHGIANDTSIARESGVLNIPLRPNERVLGDGAYAAEDLNHFFLAPVRNDHNLAQVDIILNSLKCSQRSIVENLFSRVKSNLGIFKKWRGEDIMEYAFYIKIVFFLLNSYTLERYPLRNFANPNG